MHRDQILLVLLIVIVSSLTAHGQTINIDLGQATSSKPSDGYRAGGMPGAWNKFDALDPGFDYPLVGIDGSLTAATVHQIGGTEIVEATLDGPGSPSGDDRLLLGDALVTHTLIENCLFFEDLQNGMYEVLTYAWMPTVPGTLNKVRIDTHPTQPNVGGNWPGFLRESVIYARHYVEVFDGWLRPHSGVPTGGDLGVGAAMNGIQIRQMTPEPPLFLDGPLLVWLHSFDVNAVDPLRPHPSAYDLVRGDLGTLRSSDGDFFVSTEQCLADDRSGTSLNSAANPAPGQGWWFLVRGEAVAGSQTYDAPGSAQAGTRDPGIDASPVGCF